MKKLIVLPLIVAAAPALAHEGAHLHPHGIGAGMLLLAASLVAGGAALVWLTVRK
ncbi:hypothetical protein RGUI_3405 [Rhodovulum sp. P5]|uniref:peptidase M23 n=1 Tax=Rhodovulum sp. P5 TaxID=1564506 RepID=UPI0009C3D075|nr:peptidase M23 [Rhodovulum sp. P5]ARE41546.1 hypothetical protein RGUI_3405 [Rhodovulum sp. P5]